MKRLLCALLLLPLLVLAQSYPVKPVRLIVPFPAGGATDLVARMVQAKFQEHLGQPLLMVFDTHAVNHHLYKSAPDPFRTLEHISLMVQALLGQQVNITFMSTPLILPHIKAGKVKAVAVGGKQRIAQLPDVPTLGETYPGFEQTSWFGILGPVGMPREVVARVHRDAVRTLQAPEVRDKLVEQGFQVVGSTPEEFLRHVQNESDKLGKLIRDNGIKVE